MPTTQTSTTQPTFEAAFEQIKELNEQIKELNEQVLGAARKVSVQSLDTYEKTVDRAIDLERKLAGATKQEWLKNLIDAHADIAKEMTDAYATTARSLLK